MDLTIDVCAEVLKELAQVDVDAVYAYTEALDQITEPAIYDMISSFREDHVRHIVALNEVLKEMGEEPVPVSSDFKGVLMEGYTLVRSLTGTYGALKAMESNERTTNKNYRTAIAENQDLPADLMNLLKRHYEDEKRHLAYIQKTVIELNQG